MLRVMSHRVTVSRRAGVGRRRPTSSRHWAITCVVATNGLLVANFNLLGGRLRPHPKPAGGCVDEEQRLVALVEADCGPPPVPSLTLLNEAPLEQLVGHPAAGLLRPAPGKPLQVRQVVVDVGELDEASADWLVEH